jgi:Zn-dependent protease
VNILIATSLLAVAEVLHPIGLLEAMLYGAAINAFMALFNLIPFGVLDGLKVFRWNRLVWIVLLALAALVTGLSYMSL